jgi:hypothetical protein
MKSTALTDFPAAFNRLLTPKLLRANESVKMQHIFFDQEDFVILCNLQVVMIDLLTG